MYTHITHITTDLFCTRRLPLVAACVQQQQQIPRTSLLFYALI